ncbi:hypothetical protein D6C99_10182 [Aureobasidium pullulans]|nr:hypothetical protein D6C99_10182 [Aureobasidium pullulans]
MLLRCPLNMEVHGPQPLACNPLFESRFRTFVKLVSRHALVLYLSLRIASIHTIKTYLVDLLLVACVIIHVFGVPSFLLEARCYCQVLWPRLVEPHSISLSRLLMLSSCTRIGCHPIRKKCLETKPAARTAGYWTTRHEDSAPDYLSSCLVFVPSPRKPPEPTHHRG